MHVTESTSVAEEGAWASALYLGYAHRPLVVSVSPDGQTWAPIQSSLSGAITGSVGLGGRVEVGAVLPFDIVQSQESNRPAGARAFAVPAASGLGDLGLRLKYALRPNPVGGLGISLVAEGTLPTGARGAGMPHRDDAAGAKVLADYSFLVAGLQASAGYTWRNDRSEWTPGVVQGDSLPWRFALWGRVGKAMHTALEHRAELAMRGELPVSPSAPFGFGEGPSAKLSPTLLSAAISWALNSGEDLRLLTALETSLVDAPGSPAFRAVVGLNFAPHLRDADGDGIPDDVDACLQAREDFDGFQDEDGCPEADNDNDGFGDKDDACPNQAGVASEDPRRQGCPERDSDGDGVPDDDDGCPNEPGPKVDGDCTGCPNDDRDHDTVPNAQDKCPDAAEDLDGFEDGDGCLDPDNDNDGISDSEDHCPTQAGLYSPLDHENGCPEEVADADHDLVPDSQDLCPTKPETWNGNKDTDGCPDAGAVPIWWDFAGDDPGFAGFNSSSRDVAKIRLALRAMASRIRQDAHLGAATLRDTSPPGESSARSLNAVARELSLLARFHVEANSERLQYGPPKRSSNRLLLVFAHLDPNHHD